MLYESIESHRKLYFLQLHFLHVSVWMCAFREREIIERQQSFFRRIPIETESFDQKHWTEVRSHIPLFLTPCNLVAATRGTNTTSTKESHWCVHVWYPTQNNTKKLLIDSNALTYDNEFALVDYTKHTTYRNLRWLCIVEPWLQDRFHIYL